MVRRNCQSAFTLIEVLVVLLIIGLLMSMLLPAVSRARQNANALKCISNIRQLGTALHLYAADNAAAYPMNLSSPIPRFWNDSKSLGAYLPLPTTPCNSSSVFWCPADPDAQRSYSMNIWASSAVDKPVSSLTTGKLWPHRRVASAMLLLAESWSYQSGTGSGFLPAPTIGTAGDSAGQRFGALGGIAPYTAGRWGLVNCELAYARHRTTELSMPHTLPYGRVSIFFDDGHSQMCAETDLVITGTGQSTGQAAWSTLDYVRN